MTYPKQSKTIHVENLNDELCLYDWQRKEVHALNPTAAQIWQLCDGETSPEQMADRMRASLGVDLDAAQAKALVSTSLVQLQAAQLIEGHVAGAKGVTRRQMLAWGISALLVPTIHSLLAPSPVAAQSPAPTPTNTPIPTVAPTAVADSYSVATGGTLSENVTTNDTLGTPAATVTSFGGGDLGGTVTSNAAGASVALAGGTLTVNANGQVTLTGATTPGTYTFYYRLTNSAGTSDAMVTIEVTASSPACSETLPIGNWVLQGSAVLDGSWIRLTSAANDQGGAALYPDAFPFTSNFTISFDYATFGGSGADGICVFFYDGDNAYYPPTLGAYGGGLAYSTVTNPVPANGLSHAYLGVGFDEYGNFSDTANGGPGGPGFSPDSVVLRGSGDGSTGYNYLTGVDIWATYGYRIDGVDRSSPRSVVVNLNNGLVTVMMDFGAGYQIVINNYNLNTAPGQIAAPATLRVGIAASTGGLTNNHDVSNFGACSLTI